MVMDNETTAYGRVAHAILGRALHYSMKFIRLPNHLPFNEGAA